MRSPSRASWLVLMTRRVLEEGELLEVRRHHGRMHVLVRQFLEPALELRIGVERIALRRLARGQGAGALVPGDVAILAFERGDQLPRQVLVGAAGEHRPAGIADGREGLAARALGERRDAVILGLHALGDRDQGVGVLVEHRAGAGIEAGHDLVEAPVHAVLGRVAVLVEIDQEADALDPAFVGEGRGAVGLEEVIGAVGGGAEHHPAVEAARAAAQAIAVFAGQSGDLLGGFPELIERLRRTGDAGFLEQLLVVEHGAQIEAVRQHVRGVVDRAAELERAIVQVLGLAPLLEIGLETLERAVLGIEREPGVGHLHHVRRLAGGDHGGELLERLAPGQRDDLDLGARICRFEGRDDFLQCRGALRAGDDFDQLQRGVGQRRPAEQRRHGGCQYELLEHVSPPLLLGF